MTITTNELSISTAPVGISHARISLKRRLKIILGTITWLIIGWRSRRGLRILFYHRINPYPFAQLGPVSREITVTPEAFETQLAWLKKNGYRSASPDELEKVISGSLAPDPKAVVITFDDGFEDNFLFAHPLLLKYGFQGIFFVTTQFVGAETGPEWAVGDMPGFGRFASWTQLRKMYDDGAVIASHTCSHRLLTALDEQDLRHELEDSYKIIVDELGGAKKWFVYPAGDVDARVHQAVKDAGYQIAFTTVPGAVTKAGGALEIPRSEISASDSMYTFRIKMMGLLDWTRAKESPLIRHLLGSINRFLIKRIVTK